MNNYEFRDNLFYDSSGKRLNAKDLFSLIDSDLKNNKWGIRFSKLGLNVVFKIGNGGVTDNFSSGSMYTFVRDGKIIVPAIDRDDNIFYEHPISKINIVGYKIPNYDKAIDLVKECAKKVPEVKYVGWDVAITDSDAVIIEGNCFPGVYQIKPSFVKEKVGLIPIFEKAMKIKIDKL